MNIENKINTKTICLNNKHSDFDESDAQQTIDYGNNENTFQIIYNPGTYSMDAVPAKEVRIYDDKQNLITKLTNECNLHSLSATYTCKITKNKVPSTFQGNKYNVKILNLCGEEADPKIILLVRDSTAKESNEVIDSIKPNESNEEIESMESIEEKTTNSFFLKSSKMLKILYILFM